MKAEASKKKVSIYITTYKRGLNDLPKMEERVHKRLNKRNHFVCAICLNSKLEDKTAECCLTIPKKCPKCVKTSDDCTNTHKKVKEKVVTEGKRIESPKSPAKKVQTSETEVAQGLTLLNEVLTVFQNKKVDINKEKVKTGLFKDASVSTDDKNTIKDPSRLTISTFQYSIDESKMQENGKFTVVSCCQPEYGRKPHSLDLIKHKSSSIPRMKLEELKYSLKEKSRSKDAIEEVNRMFAIVTRRSSGKHVENSNRPMVRSGPRVLPVVKNTDLYQDKNNETCFSNNEHSFKCCQTRLSSGDSITECCHDKDKERCGKCVYMLCCHYENNRKRQTGLLICERCRSLNEEHHCHRDNCVHDGC
ncbi:unnamed protein product [Chrysodeixis includens]|uniref:Uncharacterized protein n=1 Tax=Chrysodeixis includens TaxID=689277 RepID=A0A9P0BZS1_CHRIL|nr:unnamed protein product [Chrysodeixis includens]